jgi:sugar porter (SP) family MFS transporter
MAANMAGVVCAYLVELGFTGDGSWRWVLGFPAMIAAPFALGVWALPETPRWCISDGQLERARSGLTRIRDTTDVDRELNYIQASLSGGKGSWAGLLGAGVRPALIIGVCLGILQRVTGIDIAFFYGPTIFEFAGMSSVSLAILAGLGVGMALLVGQVLSLVLVDHLGRRPLLLLGYAGMVCGLAPLGLAFAMGGESPLGQWMAVGGVMLLAGAWAAGPAGVTFLLISEIYPQNLRGAAMSVATVAIWLSFLVMTFTFLTTVEFLGESVTFWGYGLISVIAVIVIYLFVPETKGKNLEEISANLFHR